MKWRDQRESTNVEDRRGATGKRVALGGLGGLVVLVLALLFGVNPETLLNQGTQDSPSSTSQAPRQTNANEEELRKFTGVVLASTEDFWNGMFRQNGRQYREPKLTLFTDQVRSACGNAGASVGPFYCPGDERIYLDLAFFQELRTRFQAPGDFAQAYVIAHEVGHHIQQMLGTMDKVHASQQRMGEAQSNDLSVRLELQADFYAGVWANYAQKKGLLEAGDLEEALRAATSIGDDRLQKETQGYAVPDSFTHGTSEQRVRWFRKGFETGDMRQGDTFNTRAL